jgi:hypothetical protein
MPVLGGGAATEQAEEFLVVEDGVQQLLQVFVVDAIDVIEELFVSSPMSLVDLGMKVGEVVFVVRCLRMLFTVS